MAKRTTLASISKQIAKGFSSVEKRMEKGFSAVAEDIGNAQADISVIKDDVKRVDECLDGLDSKVAGINRRLDSEAVARTDLKVPKRVHELEEKVFGTSRHPKHVAL